MSFFSALGRNGLGFVVECLKLEVLILVQANGGISRRESIRDLDFALAFIVPVLISFIVPFNT